MTARDEIRAALARNFEPRRRQLTCNVTSVPSQNGHSMGYVLGDLNGQRVRVAVEAGATYYPGDTLIVEQMGGDANAYYRSVGLTAGARPNSGMFAFPDATSIGDDTFGAGDVLFGGTLGDAPNWLFQYETGTMYRRIGRKVMGAIYANGDEDNGPPDGIHEHYDASTASRQTRNGTDVIAEFAGDSLSIVGWQRWGLPLGPCIEAGTVSDVDASGDPVLGAGGIQQQRYTLRMLGGNGVPMAAFRTGTQDDPDDVSFRVGADGASSYMEFADGALTVAGSVSADSGDIGGWTIGAATLTGGNVTLEAAGRIGVGTGNKSVNLSATDATYRLWAGAADPASAPFRVTYEGKVYATKVTKIVANNPSAGEIGIQGTGAEVGVKGIGSYIGVYGYCDTGYAVEGESKNISVHGFGGLIGGKFVGSNYSGHFSQAPVYVDNQDILGTKDIYCQKVYIGDNAHYLYLSGDDVYWKPGSGAAVKLN